MTTTSRSPHRPQRHQTRRLRPLPLHDHPDLTLVQRRNRDGARRQLKNVAEKLWNVRQMLADVPDELDKEALRHDLWIAYQLVCQTQSGLVLKRGRKPRVRPGEPPTPQGAHLDGTGIVAV